jgi:hypothetical protein
MPGDMVVMPGGRVVIMDTNNHVLRVVSNCSSAPPPTAAAPPPPLAAAAPPPQTGEPAMMTGVWFSAWSGCAPAGVHPSSVSAGHLISSNRLVKLSAPLQSRSNLTAAGRRADDCAGGRAGGRVAPATNRWSPTAPLTQLLRRLHPPPPGRAPVSSDCVAVS